mmetsp:Transcript_2235/g.7096  ORF Transcript_2235/g.7096 Transcript_2235/m.7096 type:complete len:243 (+) Transcript_2235:734-1462(+)
MQKSRKSKSFMLVTLATTASASQDLHIVLVVGISLQPFIPSAPNARCALSTNLPRQVYIWGGLLRSEGYLHPSSCRHGVIPKQRIGQAELLQTARPWVSHIVLLLSAGIRWPSRVLVDFRRPYRRIKVYACPPLCFDWPLRIKRTSRPSATAAIQSASPIDITRVVEVIADLDGGTTPTLKLLSRSLNFSGPRTNQEDGPLAIVRPECYDALFKRWRSPRRAEANQLLPRSWDPCLSLKPKT